MIIAFDLDGTISDPVVGISASINYALEKLGLPPRNPQDLEAYIGPPLQDIFADLLGKKDSESIHNAITFFRERYFRTGYRENVIYAGIKELLAELVANGHILYIATSKKTSIAKAVADFFRITKYFKDIFGCGLNLEKHELLTRIKALEDKDRLIMVGDRLHDMQAGKKCHCFCVGVLWGYGSKDELLGAGADKVCHNPQDLKELINHMRNKPFERGRIKQDRKP
jgi:phosphoglycolate phosphatase